VDDTLTLELRRFGDAVSYRIDAGEVTILGRHTFGARYKLRFRLPELRPEPQTFWLKNSRAPVQIGLVLTFLVALAIAVGLLRLFPSSTVRMSSLVALTLVFIGVVASLFARRVAVAVFSFTVPLRKV